MLKYLLLYNLNKKLQKRGKILKEVKININDAGQRLDKFILKYMPLLPNGMLYKGLRKNCVKVNGKHVKDGAYKLFEGDIVSLYFKDEFF